MNKYIYVFIILIIIGFFVSSNYSKEDVIVGNQQSKITFIKPKKSAHYESNTPSHGAILAATPINVVINFNFDLSSKSSISITDINNKEYGIGITTVDNNKLTLRRVMSSTSPDGIYTVNYNACWPDESCHKGHFQFVIDRSLVGDYLDLRNKSEVEIKLSEIMFKPSLIRVSSGTRITWINDESVIHYVNTDSHPGHTYHPEQNSKVLNKGDEFSLILDEVGIYPYHCSAHADNMIGSIIVE